MGPAFITPIFEACCHFWGIPGGAMAAGLRGWEWVWVSARPVLFEDNVGTLEERCFMRPDPHQYTSEAKNARRAWA